MVCQETEVVLLIALILVVGLPADQGFVMVFENLFRFKY